MRDDALGSVLAKLAWMEAQRIWPNGLRYLWTDAFGVVLLTSLHAETADGAYLERAEWVVSEVERVLGRRRGLRIGEAPERGGQYFHYLAKWVYALHCLGAFRPHHRERALEIVRQIHPAFVVPGRGVWWKMKEDLSGPYPGYGLGALDAFDALVVYRLLGAKALAREIAAVQSIVERTWRGLEIRQDLALGMMLWLTAFAPGEEWAHHHRAASLRTLDRMWIDPPGYFCREPGAEEVRFAFTNHGVALGLQAVGAWPARVRRVQEYFASYRSGDVYDTDAITHVMACTSLLPGWFLAPQPVAA